MRPVFLSMAVRRAALMFRREADPPPLAAKSVDTGFDADALSWLNHLYAVAVRLTRDPARAEDLVQDTYLKAFRFSDRFEPGTNLKAWLFAILYNTFRNDRRGARRNPVDVDSERVETATRTAAGTGSPEDALVRRSLDPRLRRALAELPEAFRQAVWLRDVEELSYADIARALDVPIGTVMSRISRGRRQLFERLSQEPERPRALADSRS